LLGILEGNDATGKRWNYEQICKGFETLFVLYAKKNTGYVVELTLAETSELFVATVLWKNSLLASEERAWIHRIECCSLNWGYWLERPLGTDTVEMMKRAALVAAIFIGAARNLGLYDFLPLHRQQTYATSTVISHCRPASEGVSPYHSLGLPSADFMWYYRAVQMFKGGSHATSCPLPLRVRRAPATMPSTGSCFRDYAGTEHD
jgi:hypothetical protein